MAGQMTNWANDYDIFDPAHIDDPFAIWDDLREHCPIVPGHGQADAAVGYALSTLLRTEHDGTPVPDTRIRGTVALTLVAGVDTTWSGIPEFELDPAGEVTWAGGQVRGPRTIPVLFPAQQSA